MTCKELTDFLDDYLDEAMETGVRQTFEHHLSVCADCRRYLESYRKTVSLTRSLRSGVAGEASVSPDTAEEAEALVRAVLASRSRIVPAAKT